jgi:hypothetical protein
MYNIIIAIPEDIKLDSKNKNFHYSVVIDGIDEEFCFDGISDTPKHAFDEAFQRLNEMLDDDERSFYEVKDDSTQ